MSDNDYVHTKDYDKDQAQVAGYIRDVKNRVIKVEDRIWAMILLLVTNLMVGLGALLTLLSKS